MPFFEKIKRKRALKQEAKAKHPGHKVRVKTNKSGSDLRMQERGYKPLKTASIETPKDRTAFMSGSVRPSHTLARATVYMKPKKTKSRPTFRFSDRLIKRYK